MSVPAAAAVAAPLIEAKNLSRHYNLSSGLWGRGETVRAVDGVSFSLTAGRTLAIVGESGCGKSTLARMIALIEPPTGGSLKFSGREASSAKGPDLKGFRRLVQMVFQDPYGSLNPRHKVGTILMEPLSINTALTRDEREQAARAMMGRVGLRQEHFIRYPHMFSGGQRQRIAIARALMLKPRVVVADEPVSALDLSIQAQVLNLMMDLQETFKLAYVFIAHDLSVVRHIADDVLVMYLGRVAEYGLKDAIFEAPRHPYTMALLSATPTTDPALRRERTVLKGELPSPLDPPPGCAFNARCPFATELCRTDRPNPRYVDNRLVACHHAETIAG